MVAPNGRQGLWPSLFYALHPLYTYMNFIDSIGELTLQGQHKDPRPENGMASPGITTHKKMHYTVLGKQ